jgi:hypothetical protein
MEIDSCVVLRAFATRAPRSLKTAFRVRFTKSSTLRQTAAFIHAFITKN